MHLRRVEEAALFDEIEGQPSETVTVVITAECIAKYPAKPAKAMGRGVGHPVLQSQAHHLADLQIKQICICVERRRDKSCQHPHCGMSLRGLSPRHIDKAFDRTIAQVPPDLLVLSLDLVSTRVSRHIDIEQAQAFERAFHGLW